MVLREPTAVAAGAGSGSASRFSGANALRLPSPSPSPPSASASSSPPQHRQQASSPDALAHMHTKTAAGGGAGAMRNRRSASEGAMLTASPKRADTGVPERKGAWLPAAIFIALSHVVMAVYLPLYTFASLRRWSTGEVGERGSLLNASWTLMAATGVSAWLNLLGITAGYHRLWSHGSYKASAGLRVFLAIIGLCSFQGSARWWVLKHRIHHRFTDTPYDPYDSTRGLWYSHCGWLFEAPPFNPKTKLIDMRDVDKDEVVRFQKRHLLWGYLLFGLVAPGLLGLLTDGSFLLGALWVGGVGRFLSWHCIWTINSLSHWEGVREFSRASSAVYVAVVNFVQNGEGHHNYHHNWPIDFRHGHRWYEWDPTKWCILFWSWLGLAWDLQRTDGNEVLQGQAQVLEAEAQQRRDAARWPTPEGELPRITEAEFKHLAEKTRGTRIIMRLHSVVLDVTSFDSHPGGRVVLQSYHGRDITAAFEGEVNLHTQAAHNLAHMFQIAAIQQ